MSSEGAPKPRWRSSLTWTGSKLIVWSGLQRHVGTVADGGIYDPVQDKWYAITTEQAPSPSYNHFATWIDTGSLSGEDIVGSVE